MTTKPAPTIYEFRGLLSEARICVERDMPVLARQIMSEALDLPGVRTVPLSDLEEYDLDRAADPRTVTVDLPYAEVVVLTLDTTIHVVRTHGDMEMVPVVAFMDGRYARTFAHAVNVLAGNGHDFTYVPNA